MEELEKNKSEILEYFNRLTIRDKIYMTYSVLKEHYEANKDEILTANDIVEKYIDYENFQYTSLLQDLITKFKKKYKPVVGDVFYLTQKRYEPIQEILNYTIFSNKKTWIKFFKKELLHIGDIIVTVKEEYKYFKIENKKRKLYMSEINIISSEYEICLS